MDAVIQTVTVKIANVAIIVNVETNTINERLFIQPFFMLFYVNLFL